MHKIPSSKPPLASPHSSAYSATNPLYFPGQKSPPTFQLSTTGSEWAREFGTQLMSNSSRQCGDTRPIQMPAGLPPPSIILEIRSGSPPGICVSACPAGCWVPAMSVPLPLRGRIMRSHSVSNSLQGNLSIIQCLTPQACLSLCHRTRWARSTSSYQNQRGAP